MLISVCIPTYNGQRFITEAVASVLNQSYREIEVIVSDHGSTDSTLEIVRAINDDRIRLVHTSRSSTVADNWNRAVSESRGAFVKVMGQDDVLYPTALETEIAVMGNQPPNVCMCFSDRDLIDTHGEVVRRVRRRLGSTRVLNSDQLFRYVVRSGTNPIGEPVAVLFRRTAWEAVGGFRGRYVIDLDFYSRIAANGPTAWTGLCVGAFRVHADSWGSSMTTGQLAVIPLYGRLRGQRPETIRVWELLLGAARALVRTPIRLLAQHIVGRRA
jgi:glycosyltransferase involved in cell wall biosynthesis